MTLRVVFMGSPDFAVPTLRSLSSAFHVVGVVTQPDKPKGRGRLPVPTPVKVAAQALGLPTVEPHDIRTVEFLSILRDWAPDVIVVAAYGKILPASILRFPAMGCVNLHASLLPRHRGASPIGAAILAGDKITGVSTMVMDEGMDTGDILLQREITIGPDDTAGSLQDGMLEPGAELVVETLKAMDEGLIRPMPQDQGAATYCRVLSKQDGRIDWKQESEYLSRLVRAMDPWPGAFTHCGKESLRIWKASARQGMGPPGVIVSVDVQGIRVGTGNGTLVIEEVQPAGKKRMKAADFARGRRLKEGEAFE